MAGIQTIGGATTLQQQVQMFVMHALKEMARAIDTELTTKLLAPEELQKNRIVHLDAEHYRIIDYKSSVALQSQLLTNGIITGNEARKALGMEPLDIPLMDEPVGIITKAGGNAPSLMDDPEKEPTEAPE